MNEIIKEIIRDNTVPNSLDIDKIRQLQSEEASKKQELMNLIYNNFREVCKKPIKLCKEDETSFYNRNVSLIFSFDKYKKRINRGIMLTIHGNNTLIYNIDTKQKQFVDNSYMVSLYCFITIKKINITTKEELYSFIKNNRIETFTPSFKVFDSNISCGVRLVNGLNNYYNSENEEYISGILLTSKNELVCISIPDSLVMDFKYFLLLNELLDSKGSIIIFSTNIDRNYNFKNIDKKFKEYFGECIINEITTYNTNSTNNIVTYTLSLGKIKEIYNK